ncbi:endonuclease/exonuclease/phosphatase family protein [Amycolatopsis lurida]
MTWNVNAGGPHGPEFDAKEIAKYRPEVIGVQESCRSDVVKMVAELRRLGLNYHVAYGTVRNDRVNCTFGGSAFGNALLSASPIRYNPATDNVLYHDFAGEERGYMAVTTKVNGKDTTVFNTHLSERGNSGTQLNQIEQLLTKASKHSRAIVLGDFNEVPPRKQIREMWKYFKDADRACAPERTPVTPNGEPVGCKTTLTSVENPNHKRKFDYIFLRGFAQPGVGVHDSPASDHHLVHADLRG